MELIELKIDRSEVYEEVAKATDYTGSKMENGDDDIRDRILITDADLETLGRMWIEAASVANDRLKAMFRAGSRPSEDEYRVTLEVSKSFDRGLIPSVVASLKSYFVLAITGKWYKYANKGEAGDYFTEAGEMMEDVLRKLYSRMRPRRPGSRGG